MGYNAYINYLDSIGLDKAGARYNYLDKAVNVANEVQRMIDRSVMMFQWHGLPDTIPERQLELILQMQGYAIIGMIDGKPYACYGGLGGVLDEYLRPTKAIVSIPYFNFNADWKIGKECVVIRNDTLMQGLLPLYGKYVSLLNETEISLLLATVNQRIEATISASDNATIESARQYLKDVMDGKQGVIADNAFLESLKVYSQKQVQGNLREIIESLHYLKAQMYNEIGLATNYNLKKERITQAEVELNTDNLYPLVDDMYYCRTQGIDEVRDLFGLEYAVELNSSWDYRAYNGEPIVTKDGANENPIGVATDNAGGNNDNSNADMDNKADTYNAGIEADNPSNDSGNDSGNSVADNDTLESTEKGLESTNDESTDKDTMENENAVTGQNNVDNDNVDETDSTDSNDSRDIDVDSNDNDSDNDDEVEKEKGNANNE